MALAVLVLVAFVVTVSVAIVLKNWRLVRTIEKLPGPLFLPFVGTTYLVAFRPREEIMNVFDRMSKQYWPLFRTWLGHTPEVHLMKAEYVEKIMTSSELITKAHIYTFLQPWLGDGLLMSTGAKWHSRRKMITPAFHFKILDNFIEVFAEKSEILIDILKTKADGKPFDIYPYITRCALDIICETAMGTSVDAQRGSQSAYVSAVYSTSEMTIKRGLSPWLHSDFIYKKTAAGKQFFKNVEILQGFTKKVINERRLSRQSNKQKTTSDSIDEFGRKRRVAFLDMLLEASEASQKLTDEAIQEEVDTFMFEGHDTTSVGMAWTLFLLGHHPDVQEKVYAELNDVFGGDARRNPSMQDLNNLKYLEMVIKESLRLYPSVPFVGRKVTQDVEVGGYHLPKGTMLLLHIRKVHRDPEHWPNPERFNPDNFLPENAQGRHPYAYVPFSAGLRNCIGQRFAILEEKTVLSYILRNFRIETVEKPEDLRVVSELVLRPVNGVYVRLTPR
ncbi:cytochrome P450 4C1-like [Schistocerca cancellata]|uniref:cytochrome P450 4C1-like n=1 Tax=Schistocerca cancellata TaxID=274614 RepID=UPI002117D001|nr:cytochrome P450 4C1-like [Schistocerca cancellata]